MQCARDTVEQPFQPGQVDEDQLETILLDQLQVHSQQVRHKVVAMAKLAASQPVGMEKRMPLLRSQVNILEACKQDIEEACKTVLRSPGVTHVEMRECIESLVFLDHASPLALLFSLRGDLIHSQMEVDDLDLAVLLRGIEDTVKLLRQIDSSIHSCASSSFVGSMYFPTRPQIPTASEHDTQTWLASLNVEPFTKQAVEHADSLVDLVRMFEEASSASPFLMQSKLGQVFLKQAQVLFKQCFEAASSSCLTVNQSTKDTVQELDAVFQGLHERVKDMLSTQHLAHLYQACMTRFVERIREAEKTPSLWHLATLLVPMAESPFIHLFSLDTYQSNLHTHAKELVSEWSQETSTHLFSRFQYQLDLSPWTTSARFVALEDDVRVPSASSSAVFQLVFSLAQELVQVHEHQDTLGKAAVVQVGELLWTQCSAHLLGLNNTCGLGSLQAVFDLEFLGHHLLASGNHRRIKAASKELRKHLQIDVVEWQLGSQALSANLQRHIQTVSLLLLRPSKTLEKSTLPPSLSQVVPPIDYFDLLPIPSVTSNLRNSHVAHRGGEANATTTSAAQRAVESVGGSVIGMFSRYL